jgi:hypothetical protein
VQVSSLEANTVVQVVIVTYDPLVWTSTSVQTAHAVTHSVTTSHDVVKEVTHGFGGHVLHSVVVVVVVVVVQLVEHVTTEMIVTVMVPVT